MATAEVDRSGMVVLTPAECRRLLASVPVGRVAFQAYGELMVLPVNHALDGEDVVFRSAPGLKLEAADAGSHVAFEVDGMDPAVHEGWSVLVTGIAERVVDPQEAARLRLIAPESWVEDDGETTWVRVHPTAVTGRRTGPTG